MKRLNCEFLVGQVVVSSAGMPHGASCSFHSFAQQSQPHFALFLFPSSVPSHRALNQSLNRRLLGQHDILLIDMNQAVKEAELMPDQQRQQLIKKLAVISMQLQISGSDDIKIRKYSFTQAVSIGQVCERSTGTFIPIIRIHIQVVHLTRKLEFSNALSKFTRMEPVHMVCSQLAGIKISTNTKIKKRRLFLLTCSCFSNLY